jgi:hypothetical protein
MRYVILTNFWNNWDYRPYSKSSLTLNEWKFNLSFARVLLLFLNSWRASFVRYYVITHPPAIQKQDWHSREAHIEPPVMECEWAFRIRAYIVDFSQVVNQKLFNISTDGRPAN